MFIKNEQLIPNEKMVIAAEDLQITLDALGEGCGIVCNFPKTGLLKKIGIPCVNIDVSDIMEITARLQNLDSDGYPNGTSYTTNSNGTIVLPNLDTYTILWIPLNGTSGVTVTRGDVVAITINITSYTSGSIKIYPGHWCYSGYISYPYLLTYVSSWAKILRANGIYCYGLQYNDEILTTENGMGPQFFNAVNYPANTQVGNKFKLPYKAKISGGCIVCYTNPYYVVGSFNLYDSDGFTLLNTTNYNSYIDDGSVAGVTYFKFPIDTILEKDTYYRLVIYPTNNQIRHNIITYYDTELVSIKNIMPLDGEFYLTTAVGDVTQESDWTDTELSYTELFLNLSEIDIPELDYPSPNNVRNNLSYQNGTSIGTLNLPKEYDVRINIEYDNGTSIGVLNLPVESDVKINIEYDNGTSIGTYILDVPDNFNVRTGIIYNNGNGTGVLTLPTESDVRINMEYDNGTSVGLLDLPETRYVKSGVEFDNSTKIGTFDLTSLSGQPTQGINGPIPYNANNYFDFNDNYLTAYQKNMYGEAVNLFGYDVIYIPIEFVESDINWVFGEINKVKYTLSFNIRMKVEGYDELHKAMLNYQKFGMLILPDNLKISVGISDFNSIAINQNEIIKPKTGDLIYFEIHNESILFEIVSTSFKYNSFYMFNVKLYNYNALNAINVGIPKIDNIPNDDAPTTNEESNDKFETINDEFEDTSSINSIWGDL
jgi:hypothetical protein